MPLSLLNIYCGYRRAIMQPLLARQCKEHAFALVENIFRQCFDEVSDKCSIINILQPKIPPKVSRGVSREGEASLRGTSPEMDRRERSRQVCAKACTFLYIWEFNFEARKHITRGKLEKVEELRGNPSQNMLAGTQDESNVARLSTFHNTNRIGYAQFYWW